MDPWWETLAGEYLNPRHVTALTSQGSGSAWRLVAYITSSPNGFDLSGTWPTQADADQAARRMVNGVDPGSY